MTDNNRLAISESLVVLNALLAEGEEKVAKLVRRGRTTEDAVGSVSKHMDLTVGETTALKDRVTRKARPVQEDETDDAVVEPESAPSADCIFFDSAEEADQAAGILMYKGIAWKSKGAHKNFIQFDNTDSMDEAHGALKRRWDFVESEDRRTAVIEFDSLGDYERVLDFMRKQNMLMNFGGDHELAEDVAVEAALRAQEGKRRSRAPERDVIDENKDVRSKDNCYRAVNRSKPDTDINPWDNKTQRVVKVRKRWR